MGTYDILIKNQQKNVEANRRAKKVFAELAMDIAYDYDDRVSRKDYMFFKHISEKKKEKLQVLYENSIKYIAVLNLAAEALKEHKPLDINELYSNLENLYFLSDFNENSVCINKVEFVSPLEKDNIFLITKCFFKKYEDNFKIENIDTKEENDYFDGEKLKAFVNNTSESLIFIKENMLI